jgi:WD40 repeat protein
VVRSFDRQADNAMFGITFSPDDILLAASHHGGTLRSCDVGSGQIASTLECDNEDRIHDVAFSPDGPLLASGGYDDRIDLWGTPDSGQ